MKLLIACLMAASVNPALAAEPVSREHLAPSGWEGSYHQLHYSPVVRIGNRVIVSGIPASEGETDEARIRWMFGQLKLHLEAAGASMDDVVELTSFHVSTNHDDFRARMEPVLKVHREFFKDHYPAWTAVGTTALFSAGAPMELRAEAIIGSGSAAKSAIPIPEKP